MKHTVTVPSLCFSTFWSGWKQKAAASGAARASNRCPTATGRSWKVPKERRASGEDLQVEGGVALEIVQPELGPVHVGQSVGDGQERRIFDGVVRFCGARRLHDLRHTAASQAVMAGENLPLVSRLLGHSRHRTTAGYAHLADAHLIEAAEKVGEAIAEAMSPLE